MTRIPPEADVVIVGSGPTGAAYARILSELAPTAQLVLLEAGPVISDPPGQHVKNIADISQRVEAQRNSEGLRPHTSGDKKYADPAQRVVRPGTTLLPDGYRQPGEDGLPALAMSTNVGGMGAHWTAACPRPGGKERPSMVPDLDDLLDEAERLLRVAREPFIDAPYADLVQERLAAAYDPGRDADRRVRAMPLAVQRREDGALLWSGSDVVFGEVTRSNPNFTLVPEALVRKVLVADGAVTGVVVLDRRDGTQHEVRASTVVVAADALRTPQLLFASGIRPRALGHWLNDQPQVVFACRIADVDRPQVPDTTNDDSGTAIIQESGVAWVPYTDQEPFHGQVMQLDASPIPLAQEADPGSIVGLGWFCGKDLQEADRIEFSDSEVDEFGMPKPAIHYVLTDVDRERIEAAKASVQRAAAAVGPAIGDAPFELSPGASLHYQGTTRMGAQDDGDSVCDPHSRVWGVDGLYVAGNNVIPTSIACNPTLLSVALAVGGARDIAKRLSHNKIEGA